MISRCLTIASLSILLLPGCGKSDDNKQARSPASAAVPPAPSSANVDAAAAPEDRPAIVEEIDPDSIAWSEHTLPGVGVSVPTMDGVHVRENTMNANSYIRQRKKPVSMAFWVGNGRTVKSWRAKYEGKSVAALSPPTTIELCGTKGVKQTLSLKQGRMRVGGGFAQPIPSQATSSGARTADSTRSSPDEKPARARWRINPASTTTVLGFERNGVPVIASWTVETEKRAAFRAAEEAYFAGIACRD